MNVTFDESPLAVVNDHRQRVTGLAGFLVRHHVVKTLTGAQVVLLSISVIIFISAGVLGHATMKSKPIDTKKNFVPAVPTIRR